MIPKPFHKLNIPLDEIALALENQRDYTAPHRDLEAQMRQYNGNLDIRKYVNMTFDRLTLIPPRYCTHPMSAISVGDAEPQKKAHPTPCAMRINSPSELEEVMSVAYSIAHFGYIDDFQAHGDVSAELYNSILAKRTARVLVDLGYSNAAVGSTDKFEGLDFVVMPFVNPQGQEGTILVDPTHNVVEDETPTGLYVRFGRDWKFEVNRYDLTPHTVKAIVEKDGKDVYQKHSLNEFMNLAYQNVLHLPQEASPYRKPVLTPEPLKQRKRSWLEWLGL